MHISIGLDVINAPFERRAMITYFFRRFFFFISLWANFTRFYVEDIACKTSVLYGKRTSILFAICSFSISFRSISNTIQNSHRKGQHQQQPCLVHNASAEFNFYAFFSVDYLFYWIFYYQCGRLLFFLLIWLYAFFWWKNPIREWYLCIYVPKKIVRVRHSVVLKQFW